MNFAGCVCGGGSFKFTVDSARDHYKDMMFTGSSEDPEEKYKEAQKNLNDTFSAITRNMGKEFAGKISYASYGPGITYTSAINSNGEFNSISKIDCVGLMATSIHILGMSDVTRSDGSVVSANANAYDAGWSFDSLRDTAGKRHTIINDTTINFIYGMPYLENHQSFDEGRINGVTNMRSNISLFERIDASTIVDDDVNGLIGVTEKTLYLDDLSDSRTWYDHVYMNTSDSKYGSTVESCGGVGIRNSKENPYVDTTKYYLQLKLNQDRMLK